VRARRSVSSVRVTGSDLNVASQSQLVSVSSHSSLVVTDHVTQMTTLLLADSPGSCNDAAGHT